jgi:hypothetical protein
MLLLLPVTRDDVMSWRCFAFSTEEWSALSLSVFFTYMYMNNLTSTHNNLPLTQLSEPLFSTEMLYLSSGTFNLHHRWLPEIKI